MRRNFLAGAPGMGAQIAHFHPQQVMQLADGSIVPLQGAQLVSIQGNQSPLPVPSVPQAQQTSLFRYGETTYYSTYLWAGGSSVANQEYRFFTTALNQVGQGFTNPLSYGETNIVTGGQLSQAQALDVFGIAFQPLFSSSTADSGTLSVACADSTRIGDLINMQNNIFLAWKFSQTTVDIAVAELVGAGGGAFGAISTTTDNATLGHMNNGAATVFLYRDYGVTLPGLTVFSILAKWGSRAAAIGTNSVAGRLVLLGQYKTLIEVA